MAFKLNDMQQLSLDDITYKMTDRELRALNKSWAKTFADELFPAINEEPFRVLFSDRTQCRSNTPINVCIGALIIKEMFQISDDEVIENLMLDPRYQYALHTTSFAEQPLSDKSLSRFRKRCYEYERLHGIDLIHECITELSAQIAKVMGITPKLRRMDSMMIEANIRILSRTELLYTCVSKLVRYIHKQKRDDLLSGLEDYLDPGNFNQMFYYSSSEDAVEQLPKILQDADQLLFVCGDLFKDVPAYQNLLRCLSEQTVKGKGKRRLKTKEDNGMSSSILQNPSDPDATYRTKAGKEYRGYAANFEETVGKNGSVITDYQFEQNNYSDSQFFKDSLKRQETSDKESIVVTDGAYFGEDNRREAEAKNITLVTTAISGCEVPDIYADFEMNEAGTRIVKCPVGNVPKSCSVNSKGHLYVSFPICCCKTCPNKDKCKPKFHKHVASMFISKNGVNRARAKRFMGTERFKLLARIRNGVETIPSLLRKQYRADRMPVRGCIPSRLFFGFKVAALNFRKLMTYRKKRGNYAPNPILEGN